MKTSMMELNVATVEGKKYKESREHKRVEESNSDRDVIKGHTTIPQTNRLRPPDAYFYGIGPP